MNTIMLATTEASAECKIISLITNWLISEQSSNPIMGVFHDNLVGIFKLTRSNTKINKLDAMRMFGGVDIDVTFNKDIYTGRELVSLILQEYNINYEKIPTMYNPQWEPYVHYDTTETKVIIEKGILVQGVLDKNSVGQGRPGTIIHEVAIKSFPDAMNLIHRLQILTDNFLTYKGMTIGIRDMLVSPECQKDLHLITSNIINNYYDITKELDAGLLVPPIGMSIKDTYEQNQIGTLKLDDDFQEKVVQGLTLENNDLWTLLQSGSKGKISNLLAMTSSLGQQTIQGKRMDTNFGFKRTLPYFTRYDDSPESKGYIQSSYMEGLDVPELTFSSMSGRHALINRALSTATVGEFTRAATKALESTITDFYRFCRINNRIVQYLYGDTAFKLNELKEVGFPTIALSDAEMKTYHYKSATHGKGPSIFDDEFIQLIKDRDLYRENFMKIEQMHMSKFNLQTKLYMPVDIKTIIVNAMSDAPEAYKKEKIVLLDSVVLVKQFCEDLHYIYFNHNIAKSDYKVPAMYKEACTLLKILIRSMLSSKMIIKYGITMPILRQILVSIKHKLQKSLVDYGDYVGILAVHSVGEVVMQYILDAHHRSGAEGTTTGFLTRLNEIMYAKITASIKNPLTYMQVKKSNDLFRIREIASHIEMIKLDHLLKDSYQILRTIDGKITHPKYVHLNKDIQQAKKHSLHRMPSNLLNYCIVFNLDHHTLIEKFLETSEIANRLSEIHEDTYALHNDISADTINLLVFTNNPKIKNREDIIGFANGLINLVIRGINGIKNAKPIEVVRTVIDKDGSISKAKAKQPIIQTVGTNMASLFLHPDLVPNTIQVNSIREIEKFLGIEAARRSIINEMRITLEGIQSPHYMVFADTMTCTGTITPIRGGAEKREINNALLNISNSFIIKNITAAASNNVVNKIYGASSSLMIGTVPKEGTLKSTIVMDTDFITKNTEDIDDIIDDLLA